MCQATDFPLPPPCAQEKAGLALEGAMLLLRAASFPFRPGTSVLTPSRWPSTNQLRATKASTAHDTGRAMRKGAFPGFCYFWCSRGWPFSAAFLCFLGLCRTLRTSVKPFTGGPEDEITRWNEATVSCAAHTKVVLAVKPLTQWSLLFVPIFEKWTRTAQKNWKRLFLFLMGRGYDPLLF